LSCSLNERPEYGESGGPAMVAAHSRRFESVFGNAEIPGALAIISCINSDWSRFVTEWPSGIGVGVVRNLVEVISTGGAFVRLVASIPRQSKVEQRSQAVAQMRR